MESLLSCEQLVQVANIKFQKDEMIQTIKNLAQSGQFAARTDVVDGCRCGDGFPCCYSSSKDALVDSHLWFEKGSLADCCSERHFSMISELDVTAGGGPPSSLAKMYPHIGRAGTPGAELIPELRGLGLDPWQESNEGRNSRSFSAWFVFFSIFFAC